MARTFDVEEVTYLSYRPWDPMDAGTKVEDRNPERDAKAAPDDVVAFSYSNFLEVVGDVDDDIFDAMQAIGGPRNVETYYIDGVVVDRDAARTSSLVTKTLLYNIEINDWPAVVFCRNGAVHQFWPEQDKLISVQ